MVPVAVGSADRSADHSGSSDEYTELETSSTSLLEAPRVATGNGAGAPAGAKLAVAAAGFESGSPQAPKALARGFMERRAYNGFLDADDVAAGVASIPSPAQREFELNELESDLLLSSSASDDDGPPDADEVRGTGIVQDIVIV
eukprot:SAG31_NODE_973_length_10632_cov_7.175622_7_plen_144_part_00